jgi:hypothetical protein
MPFGNILCRVPHKQKEIHWVNSGFQERVPTWLVGKLVHEGAYTRDIFVKPEEGILVDTPIPCAFPDATVHIAEGPMTTLHQEEMDLSKDQDDSLINDLDFKGTEKEDKQEDECAEKYAAPSLFHDLDGMAFSQDLSDEEDDNKPASQPHL